VRLACFIAAVLCLWPVHNNDILLALVPALSPFVAVASILATQAIQPMLGLGLSTGLVTLSRPRWFCRWACPMGLGLDSASCLGRHLKRKPCQPLSIGQWLLALTLGGAVLGYPLFLWLDPLALFSGLFLLTEQQQGRTNTVSILLVAFLLILSLLWPHAWCRGLCPLGAFQNLLATMSRSLRSVWKPAKDLPALAPWGHPVARRTLLGLLAGAASASILRLTGRDTSHPLRPPGAVDERTLKGLCTRCGNCMRSCPYDIIQRDTGQRGLASILTPV
ncbi:MAG: 4Fe-4S binding protein, partial [Planctomycetes bacterium]|nr:4Fe-4S binding protein [Planctomycetota bacterium]